MSENKQPIIGITMCSDKSGVIHQGVDYSIIRREYGEQVRAAGGQPIFLDSTIDPEVAADLCDGIIISGGQDIHPRFYNQKEELMGQIEPSDRTEWELELIEACDKQRIRILGVCYGNQLLNVYYGGTLYQDINVQQGTKTAHGESGESSRLRIRFHEDFLSFQKNDFVETAHRHHQAVKDLAPGFTAIATSEDGVIEAIAGHGHYGIQWHSESDGTAADIYGAFIALCAEPETEQDTQLFPVPDIA